MPGASVRLTSVRPARPWFAPGSAAQVELAFRAAAPTTVQATVELLDLDRVVGRRAASFRLAAGASVRRLGVDLPRASRRGYGVRVRVQWPGGGRARGSSAVEALEGWWASPRHAAITGFRSAAGTAAAVRALRDWHVTVVQLYDWMYRHYRYFPPSGTGTSFEDALGRHVSQDAVRGGVRAGHAAGIASLAYGSVYGAERDYVERHPDERVFDEAGTPLSLGETFYINDLRPGRPWRRRLLGQYASAVRRLGVDGIHMDTYGPPHRAIASDGQPIDFAALYPGLIAEGAATVAAARPDARVLFNCVEGFPLEQVATAPAAALYLELWPPDIAYCDIVGWIDRARALGDGRAVVIAAYISALRSFDTDPVRRRGAVEAALLLTSVIAAAGAYHHVLAEQDRLLVEGYYPEARRLRAGERDELRAAWVFGARYVHLLSDPALERDDQAAAGMELVDAAGRPVPFSLEPRAGAVWVRGTRLPDGTRVLQLLDLLDQREDRWDDIRQPSPSRSGWRLRSRDPERAAPLAMSPWTAAGAARRLSIGARDDAWRLPRFRRWMVLARPRI
jgi:dextranase